MPATDVGTGTSIVFGTSAFTANIDSIDWSGITREAINASHLGTTGDHEFIPGDLVDNGEIGLEFHFAPNDFPPIDQPAEVVTITFPIPSGGAAGATWAASAFMTDFEINSATEEKMTASATLKVSGSINQADST